MGRGRVCRGRMRRDGFLVGMAGLALLATGPDQAAAFLPKMASAAAVTAREVTVATPDARVRLAGTLSVPRGGGPFPALVLIQGQGPHTRDQMISGSPMFRMIADDLTKGGFAVLRLRQAWRRANRRDRRPTTRRLPIWRATSAQPSGFCNISPRSIRIASDCWGTVRGRLSPRLWRLRTKRSNFVLLVAPTAVPGGEVWMRQSLFNLKRHGASAAELAAIESQMRRLVEFVKGGKNDDATYYKVGHDFIAAHGMAE